MANEHVIEYLPVKDRYAVMFYAGLSSLSTQVSPDYLTYEQCEQWVKTYVK